MSETLRPEEIESRCEGLQYPVMRADAAVAFADVTVGEGNEVTNLGVVISECLHDSFTNPDELYRTIATAIDEDADGVGSR